MSWRKHFPIVLIQDPLTREDIDWLNYEAERAAIHSILTGTVYYYGYDCPRHCDNRVPEISTGEDASSLHSYYNPLSPIPKDLAIERMIRSFAKLYSVPLFRAEEVVRRALGTD